MLAWQKSRSRSGVQERNRRDGGVRVGGVESSTKESLMHASPLLRIVIVMLVLLRFIAFIYLPFHLPCCLFIYLFII